MTFLRLLLDASLAVGDTREGAVTWKDLLRLDSVEQGAFLLQVNGFLERLLPARCRVLAARKIVRVNLLNDQLSEKAWLLVQVINIADAASFPASFAVVVIVIVFVVAGVFEIPIALLATMLDSFLDRLIRRRFLTQIFQLAGS